MSSQSSPAPKRPCRASARHRTRDAAATERAWSASVSLALRDLRPPPTPQPARNRVRARHNRSASRRDAEAAPHLHPLRMQAVGLAGEMQRAPPSRAHADSRPFFAVRPCSPGRAATEGGEQGLVGLKLLTAPMVTSPCEPGFSGKSRSSNRARPAHSRSRLETWSGLDQQHEEAAPAEAIGSGRAPAPLPTTTTSHFASVIAAPPGNLGSLRAVVARNRGTRS